MTTKMTRHLRLAVFFFAAIHLLFSICAVSSRMYQTDDAVVIEVDDTRSSNLAVQPSILLTRNYFRIPAPIPYAFNPYIGLHYQQQPNFPFWPYSLYKPASSDVSNVTVTSTESKQQKIACGVGPPAPPQRTTPSVGIVGGTEATPNSWPFVVALRKYGTTGVLCGGTLISTTRILTAAYCVNKLSAYEISLLTVSLGMHTQGNLPNTVNDAQQTRRVSRVVYHANYNDATVQFNVAVLTIYPPVSYSSAISPVCLPPSNTNVDTFVDKDGVVLGWGTLSNDGTEQSNTLQQVTLKVVSNADCDVPYQGFIKPQHFCAAAAGKDSCVGDGGGPLVVQKPDNSWAQAGIISFGQACADATFPGVYTNVAFFRNWINNYMIR